jgi:hypothetical protein
MGEVTFQHGTNQQIIYKDGMMDKAREYMQKKESFENNIYNSLWYGFSMFGVWFLIIMPITMSITDNEICFFLSCSSFLFFPNLPLLYFQIRHDLCVKEIRQTPNYVTMNTSRRGYWKW